MYVERYCYISPKEAREIHNRSEFRPEEFYEAINRLLIERYNDKEIRIYQPELINLITALMKKNLKQVSERDFYDKGWLNDVKEVYKSGGWVVEYHKPDDDAPYWTFKEFKAKSEDWCRD